MSGQKTGQGTPLLNMSTMRTEDGPSLPLARNLRGNEELQGLSALLNLHNDLLLALLRRHRDVALGRDHE